MKIGYGKCIVNILVLSDDTNDDTKNISSHNNMYNRATKERKKHEIHTKQHGKQYELSSGSDKIVLNHHYKRVFEYLKRKATVIF